MSLPPAQASPTAIDVRRIDHVAVVVTDVAKAVAFYRDALGLVEQQRPETFDFPGAWLRIGPPPAGLTLHLLGEPEPAAKSRQHFCLTVTDLSAAEAQVRGAGYDVQWHAKHKIPGIDRFFVYDPDGNRVEIQGPERTPQS